MSRTIALFILIHLATCAAQFSWAGANSEYWICYTSVNPRAPETAPGGPKYIMKIDVLGNILIPPRKVIGNSRFYVNPPFGASALSQNGAILDLWVSGNPGQVFSHVFHARVDKQNLQLLSFGRTGLHVTSDYSLQVTQKTENNFIAAETYEQPLFGRTIEYIGVPISGSRLISGGPFTVFRETGKYLGAFGVAADGRIAFIQRVHVSSTGVTTSEFALQRLDTVGHPVGKSGVIAKGKITPADISNRLPGNKRFAIYEAHPTGPNLFLQAITSRLEPLGSPIHLNAPLNAHTGFEFQTSAIDPDGHFVVYMIFSSSALLFQSLDALGQPSGNPKIIVDNAEGGIDILKE